MCGEALRFETGTSLCLGLRCDRSGTGDPDGADPAGRILVVSVRGCADRLWILVYPMLLGRNGYEDLCLEAAAFSLPASEEL